MQTPLNASTALLKISEAADLLRVHRCTLQRMIKRKALPAVRIGKTIRIRKEDLAPIFPPHTPQGEENPSSAGNGIHASEGAVSLSPALK